MTRGFTPLLVCRRPVPFTPPHEEACQGFFSLSDCLRHTCVTDGRAFHRSGLTGAMDFPYPRLRRCAAHFHDERKILRVKCFAHFLVNGDGRAEFQTHNCWKPLGHPGSGDLLLAGFRPWRWLSETAAVRGTFPVARPLELPFNPAKAGRESRRTHVSDLASRAAVPSPSRAP